MSNKIIQQRSKIMKESPNLSQIQGKSTTPEGALHSATVTGRRKSYLLRLTWTLMICCSVGLFVSSVYRAATFPFTNDESLSFAGFSWGPIFRETANNHLFNTLLMQWCSTLFGNSELSLRLPNMLAHLIYLACTILLLKRFQHTALLIAGFVMLNLNPFMLDFFFLARGYGLALAFMMLSIYLLACAYDGKQQKSFTIYLFLSVSASSLAVLSNFVFLNYHLPLLLASAWLILSDTSLRRFSRNHLPTMIVLFSASGIFLAFILSEVFRLQRSGELYFGGNTGFIADTVGSLVRCSLYSVSGTQATEMSVSAVLVGLFILLLILGFNIFFLKKEAPLYLLFLLVMASAVALPILQHRLFQTLFPIERAALYYLPLNAVVLLFALDWLERISYHRWQKQVVLVLPIAIAVIFIWNFTRNFSTQSCYNWGYERHNYEILKIIDRDRKHNFPDQIIGLADSELLGPSLDYYRITRKYTWLAPVTKPIIGTRYNYIYAFEREVKGLGQTSVLAYYPDTQTVLLRINSAQSMEQSGAGLKR
jgi:hypothetical protein